MIVELGRRCWRSCNTGSCLSSLTVKLLEPSFSELSGYKFATRQFALSLHILALLLERPISVTRLNAVDVTGPRRPDCRRPRDSRRKDDLEFQGSSANSGKSYIAEL